MNRFEIIIFLFFSFACGIGLYTFYYAKGASYLTNDPQACANCHIMEDHYSAWLKSSHRNVATCNDCHAPHDIIGKYFTKALNGFNHSLAFTTGRFSEPISITKRNHEITEASCRYCHANITNMIDHNPSADQLSCVRCHANIGHAH